MTRQRTLMITAAAMGIAIAGGAAASAGAPVETVTSAVRWPELTLT